MLAAQQVLNYKWTKDTKYLDAALPLLEKSLDAWKMLCLLTEETYLYANSMQTAQRRVPIGGDKGHYKTWQEMLPVYEEELENLKVNIEKLHTPQPASAAHILPVRAANVQLTYAGSPVHPEGKTQEVACVPLAKDALLFEGRTERIDTVAPELQAMRALVLNRDTTRIQGTTVEFNCQEPVKMLVGFFVDDDPKWARPPKLETDATGNEYGQAEPVLSNAVNMTGMPTVNIHAYHFGAGHHVINLPKGIIMVAGFTADDIKPRDASLQGAGDEIDWLFMK